jgi:ribosomal protein S21
MSANCLDFANWRSQFRVKSAHMAEVRLQESESLENALRRFKRKVQTEGIIKEVKRHSFYFEAGREAQS